MYTLTEISKKKDNVSYHQHLGSNFSIIDREASPMEFEKTFNAFNGNPEKIISKESFIDEKIYCFIVSEGGKEIHTLYKSSNYYIVTESGKTFKNLSFR